MTVKHSLLLTAIALWLRGQCINIDTKEEFLQFSKKVTQGNTYKEVTIYLNTDLDLKGDELGPIGPYKGDNTLFMGTFDGQGHVISNLNLTTSEQFVGLFGSVTSGSISNVIIDESCRIVATNETHDIYIGGLASVMAAIDYPTFISNCVNMASISGYGTPNSAFGGILGTMVTYGEKVYIKNCANFGDISVKKAGTMVGGLLGFGMGSMSMIEIFNCLNYGNVFYDFDYEDEPSTNETTMLAGGIVGNIILGDLRNCVNMGTVKNELHSNVTLVTGCICGNLFVSVGEHCYCKTGSKQYTGNYSSVKVSYFDEDFVLEDPEYGSQKLLVSALNNYSQENDMNDWFLNKDNRNVKFIVDTDEIKTKLTFKSDLILTPRTYERGYHFEGWYKDSDFNYRYNNEMIKEDITLFGKEEKCSDSHTITFSTNGKAHIKQIHAKFGTTVYLPHESYNNGREVIGQWLDERNERVKWEFTMPAEDVTLYAVWVNTTIRSPDEFKTFSKNVNSGMSFPNITIFLEDDIDMTGITMDSIGVSGNSFEGTFDGKGHTIKGLNIASKYPQSGIFGYSLKGMNVRNIIVDQSCTISGVYSSVNHIKDLVTISTGGIIGYCFPKNRECVLENALNLGTVTHIESTSDDMLYIGGLVGYFTSDFANSIIRNSLFMGSIELKNIKQCGIGGIIGGLVGSSSYSPCRVENSMNSGRITYKGTTSKSSSGIGGIAGIFSENAIVQNCLNVGTISASSVTSTVKGNIVGILINAVMKNCYWHKNGGEYGYGKQESYAIEDSIYFGDDFNLKDKVTVLDKYNGYSAIGALNAFAMGDDKLSKWAANGKSETINFVFDKAKSFPASTIVILLPSFVSSNNSDFFGWYKDPELTEFFTERDISGVEKLYGEWGVRTKFISTFKDEDGRTVKSVSFTPGKLLDTSSVKISKKGHTLIGWLDDYGWLASGEYAMPRRNITFTALWLKTHLRSPEDLKDFSRHVNNGVNCLDKTIYLDKDIDMSGVTGFEPIGTNEHPFMGTFEGQGHRISNLQIKTDAQYSGLCGNSYDATLMNFFLDGVSSVENRFPLGYGCTAGILGYCGAEKKNCTVINVVNYADVTVVGQSSSNTINSGGIMGLCKGFYKNCVIVNCANFGSITHVGSTSALWIGGVIGRCSSWSREIPSQLYGNVNYGLVSHSGSTTRGYLGIGGLIGYCDEHSRLNGCVSLGNVVLSDRRTYVGTIFGRKKTTSDTTNNIWLEAHEYGDFANGNIMLNDDFALDNGTALVDVLRTLGRSKPLLFPKGRHDSYNYTSTWVVNRNNARITMKLGKRVIATYNSSVVLLPTLVGSVKNKFVGWERGSRKILTEEVFKDTVYSGEWKIADSKALSNFILSIVHLFVLLIIGIFIAVYVRGYMKRLTVTREIKELIYPKVPEGQESGVSLNSFENLYPSDYKRPKMEDALRNAGLNDSQVRHITGACYKNAYELQAKEKLPKELTVDDAAAIAMYTFDFGTGEIKYNPYRLINSALNNKTEENLRKVRDILYLVISSLRKLPVVHGIHLYRGIRVDVTDDNAANSSSSSSSSSDPMSESRNNSSDISKFNYKEDSIITWNALSSTSPSMNVTKNFLARGSSTGKAAGTLFIIENCWGYDIQPYSLFPTESEILLEPERQFQVVSVISADLTIVKLKMLKTFIPLPNVYGKHVFKVSPMYFIKERANKYGRRRRRRHYNSRKNSNIMISDIEEGRGPQRKGMRSTGRQTAGIRSRLTGRGTGYSDSDYSDSDNDDGSEKDVKYSNSDSDSDDDQKDERKEFDVNDEPNERQSTLRKLFATSQDKGLKNTAITQKLL